MGQKYYVYTRVKSNVPAGDLYYTMEIYRDDGKGGRFHALPKTVHQPLTGAYTTQKHAVDVPDTMTGLFIASVMLYKQDKSDETGQTYIDLFSQPKTAIVNLIGNDDDDEDRFSRYNVVYLETSAQTQKTQGGSANTSTVQITARERIFVAPEHPIDDPLDPFAKERIEKDLKDRLAQVFPASLSGLRYPYGPDQGRSSLCGPAAFFYCLLRDRPDIYKQVVTELWETGKTKIGNLEIKPSEKCRRPVNYFRKNTPKVLPIDWVTLASLRDSENGFLSYDSPGDETSGITFPWTVSGWFEKVGAEEKFDNVGLARCSVEELCQLNGHIGDDTHVVTLVGSAINDSDGAGGKNHWIVWEDKIRLINGDEIDEETKDEENVILRAFSWGEIHTNYIRSDLTLGQARGYIFGGKVFSRIP